MTTCMESARLSHFKILVIFPIIEDVIKRHVLTLYECEFGMALYQNLLVWLY
jgi:hypothetical protein